MKWEKANSRWPLMRLVVQKWENCFLFQSNFIRGNVDIFCISGVCVLFTRGNVVPLDCQHCVKSCLVNDLNSWEGILFLPCIHLTCLWWFMKPCWMQMILLVDLDNYLQRKFYHPKVNEGSFKFSKVVWKSFPAGYEWDSSLIKKMFSLWSAGSNLKA